MTTDRERKVGGSDDVAALLRHAGPRPPVPSERIERARKAAHSTWRQDLRSRSRRRNLWTAAALLAAASVVLAVAVRVWPTGAPPAPVAVATIGVDSTIGPAWLLENSGSGRRGLTRGDSIRTGHELLTGPGGLIAIRLPSGHSVRLDQSTRVRALGPATLALERGALYVDSGGGNRAEAPLTIQTPLGAVRDIGTQFEVRYETDNALRVRVREGRVTLNHEGRVHEILQETAMELSPSGRFTTQTITTHDAGWDWASSIVPMPDLEGRTARMFLNWVARERGWKLAFVDETVARAAEETIVAGSVSGMTLDQALDAVLPSCRLERRLSNGILWIDSSATSGSGE